MMCPIFDRRKHCSNRLIDEPSSKDDRGGDLREGGRTNSLGEYRAEQSREFAFEVGIWFFNPLPLQILILRDLDLRDAGGDWDDEERHLLETDDRCVPILDLDSSSIDRRYVSTGS